MIVQGQIDRERTDRMAVRTTATLSEKCVFDMTAGCVRLACIQPPFIDARLW